MANKRDMPSVAVAMSGGVDSSVTAVLLHEAGYRVVGFTLKLWSPDNDLHSRKPCCTAAMARDAARVCANIGVPHYTLDLRVEFQLEVIDTFEREYLSGRTPNPCVHCNSRVKWGALLTKARTLGLNYISTGHYARLDVDRNGKFHLRRGADVLKDQSYFLWEIPRQVFERTLFPLGERTKNEVRELAHRYGLTVADKVESQEVCFVPDDDYRAWLSARHPEIARGSLGGEMIAPGGEVLGRHPGYPFFTIGQRKGLGTGGGRKYYVTRIDATTRRVYLGEEEDLNRTEFRAAKLNRLQDVDFDGSTLFTVKVRYRDPGVTARVWLEDDNQVRIRCEEPIKAVTPGQSAVVYLGDEVIAGGIIE